MKSVLFGVRLAVFCTNREAPRSRYVYVEAGHVSDQAHVKTALMALHT